MDELTPPFKPGDVVIDTVNHLECVVERCEPYDRSRPYSHSLTEDGWEVWGCWRNRQVPGGWFDYTSFSISDDCEPHPDPDTVRGDWAIERLKRAALNRG